MSAPLTPDRDYLQDVLTRLLNTPSPSGMTDAVSRLLCNELTALGIPFEIIPGVTATAACAALLESELTLPGIAQTVILTRYGTTSPMPGSHSWFHADPSAENIPVFRTQYLYRQHMPFPDTASLCHNHTDSDSLESAVQTHLPR